MLEGRAAGAGSGREPDMAFHPPDGLRSCWGAKHSTPEAQQALPASVTP